jgi:biopolymer transport protein ExbD
MSSAGDSKRFGFPDDDKPSPHDSRRAAIEYDASKQDTSGSSSDISYKNMGWKGIDEPPDDDYEPEMGIQKSEPIPEDDLDMTPMIDVTFLLLIFFMVTASFTLQQSFEQPPAKSDEPSTTVAEEEEVEDDYIEVLIDQNNTYYVTTRDVEELEAPSDTEMRTQVLDAKNSSNATRLIITAHVDSFHRKLVTVWDTGLIAGLQMEIKTTEEDY